MALIVLLCSISVGFAMGGGSGASGSKSHRGFEGKVVDAAGNNLKGVEITLVEVEDMTVQGVKDDSGSDSKKPLSRMTGSNGKYRFIAVRPGFYRVTFSMNGYQTLEKLMEFKRGSKDAVLNVKLPALEVATTTQVGN